MSAFGELRRDGQFGPAGLALLGALMEQEARRLPVLGRTHWPLTRVEDLTQSFFVERGMALTTNLVAAGVTDDVALGKYVRRSVRNWLTDQARKTDRELCVASSSGSLVRSRPSRRCRPAAPGRKVGVWLEPLVLHGRGI